MFPQQVGGDRADAGETRSSQQALDQPPGRAHQSRGFDMDLGAVFRMAADDAGDLPGFANHWGTWQIVGEKPSYFAIRAAGAEDGAVPAGVQHRLDDHGLRHQRASLPVSMRWASMWP